MDPRLPPELERKIFELASTLHPRSMPKLILVAQRVDAWIRPLLYRVLSIASSQPGFEPTGDDRSLILRHPFTDIERLLAFVSKPESLSLRENVRHIRFPREYLPQHITQLLTACPAAVDVVLPMHSNTTILLPPLPLQRLVLYWKRLSPSAAMTKRQMLRFCPKLTHLTHLEIRDWREYHVATNTIGWEELALIPRLTHLCFHELDSMISIIAQCLQHCKSLDVLVISGTRSHTEMMQKRLEGDMVPGDPLFLVDPPVASDPRFLILSVRDYYQDVGWEAGARGSGEDFWAAADRHVRKRRAGETNDYIASLEDLQLENS
ncbi:hypothetical protein C8F01DRAFT_177276 [Mycena amicta]|nr:hypothetical protein C8F01DRAFT_177276 [Mycena amicta]